MRVVVISSDMEQLASQWNDAILATGLAKTPNYTGLHAADRFRNGYVGELVVAGALAQRGIAFEHRVVTNGRAQDSEFVVWRAGQRASLEIKTASRRDLKNFLVAVGQRVDADVFVAVRLDRPRAEIMGCMSRAGVLRLPVITVRLKNHACPFESMPPIDRLYAVLDKGDGITTVNGKKIARNYVV